MKEFDNPINKHFINACELLAQEFCKTLNRIEKKEPIPQPHMGIRPNRSRNNHQKKEEMITITIIICITAILIVAIVCYKEYKMSNGSNLERIESKLNSLDIVLRCNDRTLGNLADSFRKFKEEKQNDNRTSK